MGGHRHKWQGTGAPGTSCCVNCGIYRQYYKSTATYRLRDGSTAVNSPRCIPPEKVAGGLHNCPAGGMCWCTGDKETCIAKAAPLNDSNPNQLTLF